MNFYKNRSLQKINNAAIACGVAFISGGLAMIVVGFAWSSIIKVIKKYFENYRSLFMDLNKVSKFDSVFSLNSIGTVNCNKYLAGV